MTPSLELRTSFDDGAATIELRGALDLETVGSLLSCVGQLGTGIRLVRLDLAGLEFIDSLGISGLVAMHRQLELDLWALELVNLQGQPLRVLEMAGLLSQLTVR